MPLKPLTAAEVTKGRTVRYVTAGGKSFNATAEAISARPSTPSAPGITTQTSGGTLGATLSTSYRFTVVIGGVESLPSAQAQIVTGAGSTNQVTLTWSAITNAQFYRVYGRTAGTELLMATIPTGTLTFIDTGAVTPSGALPSGSLTTGSATLRVSTMNNPLGSRLIGAVPPATAEGQTGVYYHRW